MIFVHPGSKILINVYDYLKMFIKDQEICKSETLPISSIEDIDNLLLEMDRYVLCAGVDNRYAHILLLHMYFNIMF